jgi:hypothetical protein
VNTQNEALKLALKALDNTYALRDDVAEAITAIKQALAAPVQEPVSDYIKKIEDLIQERDDARSSRDFYKRRADALQEWQSKMRDPERTIVCDILANGCTLEPAGDRYTTPPAQHDRVRELECVIADLKAEYKELLAAQPAPVQYQRREIGEGDFVNCTKEQYEYAEGSPQMDTRVILAPPAAQPAVPLTEDEMWDLLGRHPKLPEYTRAVEARYGIAAAPEKGQP